MSNNAGTCTYCGSQFRRGWCLSKHIRACAAINSQTALMEDTANHVVEDEDMSENGSIGVAGGLDVEDEPVTDGIAAAVTQLPQPRPLHRDLYRLNAKHLETMKFLAPMCVGHPVSDGKMTAMLKYAKTLESARATLLPKTTQTAWRRLCKVISYAH